MAVDWSVIVSGAVGATIGLIAPVIFHAGARRQDKRTFSRMREESDRRDALTRSQEIRTRELDSIFAVIRAFHHHPVGPLRVPSEFDVGILYELSLVLFYEQFNLTNADLRKRVLVGAGILEAAADEGPPDGLTNPAVAFVVRRNILRWLAACLRNEPMPDATADWTTLDGWLDEKFRDWREQLGQRGIVLADYRLPVDHLTP